MYAYYIIFNVRKKWSICVYPQKKPEAKHEVILTADGFDFNFRFLSRNFRISIKSSEFFKRTGSTPGTIKVASNLLVSSPRIASIFIPLCGSDGGCKKIVAVAMQSQKANLTMHVLPRVSYSRLTYCGHWITAWNGHYYRYYCYD